MRKRCKRKIWSMVNPIEFAITGAAITAEDKLNQLRMSELSAIESLVKGNGTTGDWKVLVDMMNIAETMGNHGIGIEVLPVCEIVQAEMEAAAKRYETTRWAYRAQAFATSKSYTPCTTCNAKALVGQNLSA